MDYRYPSGEPKLVYDWTISGSTEVKLDREIATIVPITKAHHIVEMLFHYIVNTDRDGRD